MKGPDGLRRPISSGNYGRRTPSLLANEGMRLMKPIPIAELPKDTERALVWGQHRLTQEFVADADWRDWYTANWFGDGNYWTADGEGFVNGVTHWMPIPAPPGRP
jgi:hypothetical protein